MPDFSSGGGGGIFSVGFTEVSREKLGVFWFTAAFNIKINVFINVFLTSDRVKFRVKFSKVKFKVKFKVNKVKLIRLATPRRGQRSGI